MAGPNDPKTKLAVELGAEHPGALWSRAKTCSRPRRSAPAHAAGAQAQQQLANSPAGKLLAMTHDQIMGGTQTMFVPKPDISRDWRNDDNDILTKLAKQVMEGYDFDKRSRAEWEKRSQRPWTSPAGHREQVLAVAERGEREAAAHHHRGDPVPRARLPGDRARAADREGRAAGQDPDGVKMERGDRIGKHMSYQVLEEMPDWEEDTDKLLLNVSIVGCAFRKTYFDHTVGANRSEMVVAKHLVVNHRTKNLTDARRVTRKCRSTRTTSRSACARGLPRGRPQAAQVRARTTTRRTTSSSATRGTTSTATATASPTSAWCTRTRRPWCASPRASRPLA
jgi:hypothetical protein